MITAIVKYRLPDHIGRAACRRHFQVIAEDFRSVPGLISKHFIYGDDETAGGVYQWESREQANAFYAGPWLGGIVERYGMDPEITFYEVFAVTDNKHQSLELDDS